MCRRFAKRSKLRLGVVVTLGAIAAIVIAPWVGTSAARASDVAGGPFPTGTLVTTTASDPSCPAGQTCQGIEVSCPGVQRPARGFLATAPATGPTRGLVVISTGGPGTEWFTSKGQLAVDFVADLQADGFVVVQLRWVDSWLVSAAGEDAGSGHLACRPATVFKWVHDTHYLALGLPRGPVGRCGFCITGNSGGSSQSSYALSHYGLDAILDAVVPTGGPPHAAQAKGCLRNVGEEGYWYPSGSSATIDSSYGFAAGEGPCALHDPSFVPRWDAESVDTGGSDYLHPATRIHFIFGSEDNSSAVPHGMDYANRLRAAGSPDVTVQVIQGMGHSIVNPDGLAALHAALLAGSSAGYPRPKGATPVLVSLVPAYAQCVSPNTSHGAPLDRPSCEPPTQASSYVTVGTPDANGKPSSSVGSVRLDVIAGDPSTGADEADVRIKTNVTDVRQASDLAPYGGELQLAAVIRITDRDNGAAQLQSGTVTDIGFPVTVPCVAPASPIDVGATCAVTTTADSVVPGAIVEGKRAIWELGQVELLDGGSDGDADTLPNGRFASQGIFVP